MGYRSDLAAAFYVQDKKHLPVLKLWVDENFPVETFANEIRWFAKGMLVEERATKWYDDYEEVQAFNVAVGKFLQLVHKKPEPDAPEFSFEFVRIGENYDDIETQYEGDHCEWLLDVRREITMEV